MTKELISSLLNSENNTLNNEKENNKKKKKNKKKNKNILENKNNNKEEEELEGLDNEELKVLPNSLDVKNDKNIFEEGKSGKCFERDIFGLRKFYFYIFCISKEDQK
ncbi:unnamed protein product [Meloidogyne enterolobii]|uniref:Uncharacterized protein n=1 Tax=Meloidogyne enterolobii TaxID=390850 RepID=A0ACB0ZFH4_MELEN